MPVYTQDERIIAIKTPLGKDTLLLKNFKGVESISSLFSFHLGMISEDHNISFESITGENVTVSLTLSDGSKKYFNGIISGFSQAKGGGETIGSHPRFSYYSAKMVPWLWLLTRTTDSRIFQDLSVPDIIEKIFTEKGFLFYSFRLNNTYDPREYCVQYGETDFDFISRLLEEEGIYYFFEHEYGKHTLVIADSPDKNPVCPKQESASYHISGGGFTDEDVITALDMTRKIKAGKYTLNDYNFEIPSSSLMVEASAKKMFGPGEREIYEYPGFYSKRGEGEKLSAIRMEEEEANVSRISGESTCRAFSTGFRFRLEDHYRDDMNGKEYLLTRIEHEIRLPEDYTGASGILPEEIVYKNRFVCIPHKIPYRPRRKTPKPFVKGVQTAIVTGPAGEEIYTDKYGRVKVRFHWDREGKNDEKSSCWIRVAQLWAGVKWGAMYIPRIGHEVIVDFLEGDPDRPIITGRVYHGTNMPPYDLPSGKTKSTIKSDSTPGGGGSNELRFEDKKGKEEVYLHGQKDWTIQIENDKNQTIGHDESLSVGNNRTKSVGNNQQESIGADKSINVGKNHSETIKGAMTQTVALVKNESIGGIKNLSTGDNYIVRVGTSKNEIIADDKTIFVGNDDGENISGTKTVNVEKGIFITSASSEINITANTQITLSVGASSVTINGDQIALNSKNIILDGENITLKGSKEIGAGSGSSVITLKPGEITTSSPKINTTAIGIHEISGALIKIN